ncbi:3-carboxy-cis,cis-muconate cycloisomerase [Herbaspirillum rubrisubalbicans]|uniref:3-carboxy-cis,cis-muconate cycloisomerase n=1 Tax=Herbaspirillum rubrisubalbicans TaxID=80842 RepID=UPI00209C93A3|nr:3-carboxy-cis,cis-muconate cycloisomerase [Herbaspirillum rubrisubalbicans]MCP1574508.1 3-carboxy-cis,cis-muconate cycloisomerase [Herbaspirillum rubrisubalbicans]
MSVSIFDSFLTTSEMIAVFDDQAVVQAMLRFEQVLAEAEAAEGIIPEAAARAIASVCRAPLYDINALIVAGRRAGALAIPLVKELQRTVALYSEQAATHVHWGSTSQDVLDTAMVLVTRDALRLVDGELAQLSRRLLELAQSHLATPVLARTLMQPAQVTSLGLKFCNWAAPLLRARAQLQALAERALQLQLGGAVGTLSVLGEKGPAVAARMAAALELQVPQAAWHTQRDEWIRLGTEMAVLAGSLGKIATDLSLMAQGEIAELAEPSGNGRGGSSAMPHKRNPVSSMIALAAAARAPQQAATLLATMSQQHERGLGNWQAELAEWPALFLGVHGALRALNDAFAGLVIDAARMLRNIDALQGLVFTESASIALAGVIGRPRAHALLEQLTAKTVAAGTQLVDMLVQAVQADAQLGRELDLDMLRALFDPVEATLPARRIAERQLDTWRTALAQ